MRLLITAIMTIGVAAAACTRGATVAASTGAVNAAAVETAGDPTGAAVATSGGTETSSAAAGAVREVTIPAGTRLPIVLDTPVSSASSRVEQSVQAHLSRPIVVRGRSVLPQGSRVSGVVTDATRSGRVKGLAHLALRFDTLIPRGDDERYRIQTAAIGRTAEATKKKDAAEIGIPAAGGALIGALLEVLICSDYPTQLAVGNTFAAFGYAPAGAGGTLNLSFVAGVSAIDTAFLLTLILAFLYAHGERPRDVLFGFRSLAAEAALGIPLTLAALALAAA